MKEKISANLCTFGPIWYLVIQNLFTLKLKMNQHRLKRYKEKLAISNQGSRKLQDTNPSTTIIPTPLEAEGKKETFVR